MNELPIIQKTYDLVKWYVPILNRLPKNFRFTLATRINRSLYDLLEGLLKARFAREKVPLLEDLNSEVDILQYQTRLLLDFGLISTQRYKFVGEQLTEIGIELGSWIKQQRYNRNP